MPKVSVLMPVYNTKGEYLKEAIESILNQTYTDFEFIIINDGSTNNAEDVILSYKDDRIKYYKQENKGIISTLNYGLSLCNGEYIARMDSDDISLSNRLKKQVEILDNNSTIGVVGALLQTFSDIDQTIYYKEKPRYIDLLRGNQLGHPVVMIRKSILEKFNLKYGNYIHAEDYELWSRIIKYCQIYNIQEVLLKYRIHSSSISVKFSEPQIETDKKIKQKMLDFLTDDNELQQNLKNLIFSPSQPPKIKYTFWEKLFSVKNQTENGIKRKVLTILGIKFKFRKTQKTLIVKLMGGLGNQMFQYAFSKALEQKTHKTVMLDKSWFEESQKTIINEKRENSAGVVMREYNLDIFNIKANFTDENILKNAPKRIFEKKEFEFDQELLKNEKSAIYEGYFQNEGYFKDIKEIIKKDFTFPEISIDDEFNQQWLTKIKVCENPVFIHIRRGDYVNLGWDLSTNYYKKAIEYIKQNVDNPTFFVFGQDCKDYIEKEFSNLNAKFEIVGEENSKNREDWKDIVLMEQCKHAIIANSTFSWWAAWLGRANEQGIVVAPTPFVNGKDSIICDNWVRVER